MTSFSLLLILPTGNTNPALDDLDFPPGTVALAFPSFPLTDPTAVVFGAGFGTMLSKEPVRAKAAFNFFFSF